ncbi:hypothetical protein [Leyella stercorea]|uniref:hypothetical protein n=1 Tax=Leyella stercorea TaxID=363265 RepID=UPI00242B26E8|nr:hypothetical protein [Leyella stercorea]
MIRIDRRRYLRRPMRMSAPTDADVCTDRCGCLHRPMRMISTPHHLTTTPSFHHLTTTTSSHHLTTSTSYPLRCE